MNKYEAMAIDLAQRKLTDERDFYKNQYERAFQDHAKMIRQLQYDLVDLVDGVKLVIANLERAESKLGKDEYQDTPHHVALGFEIDKAITDLNTYLENVK